MKNRLHLFLALGLLGGAFVLCAVLLATRPAAEPRVTVTPAPLVRVVRVQPAPVRIAVEAHGQVSPRVQIDVVPEVSGRVVEVSPHLAEGGYFSTGDTLLRIDPSDYRLAVRRAEATVAQAQVAVARESAESKVARREWAELGTGEPSPLVLRRPQLAQASAALDAARAELERAQLDLDRTVLKAPFEGRTRRESVDVGQFVARGTALATIYSTDVAEIRLPLPDNEMAYLDISLSRATPVIENGPEVVIHSEFAGSSQRWKGRVVRTDGQVDPRSRMLVLIAEVDDPYGRRGGEREVPLAIGLFVDATIQGREFSGVVNLPRVALRSDERVLIIDDENRLRWRQVSILRREPERILIRSGLEKGERVCVSPLDVAVEGMLVRVEGDESVGDAPAPTTKEPGA